MAENVRTMTNGDVEEISYYTSGVRVILHSEDGPAKVIRNADGVALVTEYYKHGVLHREDGPAHTLNVGVDPLDLELVESYFYNGIPRSDWELIIADKGGQPADKWTSIVTSLKSFGINSPSGEDTPRNKV